MTRNNAYWLVAALAITPIVAQGCGGDETTTTAAGGTGGTGGASSGGTGGATGGASGSGGSAGTAGGGNADGGPVEAGMLPDGRNTCGANNCSTNPTGTNICDTASGRCVDCLMDTDCAIETTNKHCDVAPLTTGPSAGLPSYTCEECTNSSHCPTGATCVNGDCETPCGTAMCETGEVCDAANNRCIDCLSDSDCADETTDKRCDLRPNTAGLPTGSCEECLDSTHCPVSEVCFQDNCEPSCTTDMNCSVDGGGNSPYCNTSTKVCVECITDTHCPTTQPRCSATNGECVECLMDTHCTNAMQPFCDDEECVQCRTTADCPVGQTCITQGQNSGSCSSGMDAGRGGG